MANGTVQTLKDKHIKVGVRVLWISGFGIRDFGTITKVTKEGYFTVKWDDGKERNYNHRDYYAMSPVSKLDEVLE